jgi:serine/threonine protein phosphatase PrpC
MAEELVALDVSGQTDIGLKRQRNEDFCEYRIPTSGSPQYQYGALFIVADGMGGMGGGDVASQTAVKEVMQRYYAPETPEINALASLRAALEAANVAVREQAKQLNRVRIGSTAAGLVLLPAGEALLFNVGDSRVYRVRQSYIELMTHDQSVMQGQIDGGLISEEDARQARNVNVTAFIGQPTPLQPVFRRTQAQLGDIFVICSDGLWDLVEPHELLNAVQRMPAEAAARKLIALARQRGGPDNITVIIVRLGPKPAARRWWLWGVLAAALVLIVAGVIFAATRGGTSGTSTHTPTASQVVAAVAPSTEPTVGVTDTAAAVTTEAAVAAVPPAGPTETSAGGIVIFTSTPTHTLSPTPTRPTATPTNTPKPSATRTPTAQPSATRTLRPTITPTLQPSDTATKTPVSTRTPTATLPPTATPQPSATRAPTVTRTIEPTVTLDPSVITWTPAPPPTATPTLSPAELMLVWANQDGVALTAETTLYQLYRSSDTEPYTLLDTISLQAGTQVQLLSDTQQPHPTDPTMILRDVLVMDGLNRGIEGWIDQLALENAQPIVPRVTPKEDTDVNVRSGDSLVFNPIGRLEPGEYALILGVSTRNSDWYRVQLPDGTTGWVASSVVVTVGDVSNLPAAVPPPIPVRPTFTPEPTTAPDVTQAASGEPPPNASSGSGGGGQ